MQQESSYTVRASPAASSAPDPDTPAGVPSWSFPAAAALAAPSRSEPSEDEREHAAACAGASFPVLSTGALGVVVDGRRGQDGRAGRGGSHGSLAGAHGAMGEPGEDGGRPTDAGEARLSLCVRAGQVVAAARAAPAGGTAPRECAHTTPYGEPDGEGRSFFLSARGGRGGAGGPGGSGGRGAQGRRGRNATRHSSGGDGGRGGDGGAGGRGGDGFRGGRGGRITVVLPEENTDLALLLNPAPPATGGPGGTGGAGGRPGGGGHGGSGGSSYSWTTHSTHTDSQGHRRTTTHHHSNRGGDPGPGGRDGMPGLAGATAPAGPDGTFEVLVVPEGGAEADAARYRSFYDLWITHVRHRSENGDSVNEPGEEVSVWLTVRNVGGMPTPARQRPRFFVQPSGWIRIRPEHEYVELAEPLAPGEERELPPIRFRVGMPASTQVGDALRVVCPMDFRASLPGVNRPFARLCAQELPFDVRFPVEISPVVGAHAVAHGEEAPIVWRITNVSSREIGGDTPEGRMLGSCFQLIGRSLDEHRLVFRDREGRVAAPGDGLAAGVDRLAPGASADVVGTVEFDRSVPPYTRVRTGAFLELGALDEPNEAARVQRRDFDLQLAEAYVRQPDADMLLVVNSSTTADEIAMWRTLARAAGRVVNLWNCSYYDGATFFTPLACLGGRCLADDFRGGVVVFLNNYFSPDTAGFLGDHAMECIQSGELYRLVHDANAHIYVAGSNEGMRLRHELMPPPSRPSGRDFPMPQRFVEDEAPAQRVRHEAAAEEVEAPGRGGGGGVGKIVRAKTAAAFASGYDMVKGVTSLCACTRPQPGHLHAEAEKLRQRLAARHPERRYLVTETFDAEQVKTCCSCGIRQRWNLGELRVQRGPDIGRGSLVYLELHDSDAPHFHEPSFVYSAPNVLHFVKALPFADKVSLLGALLAAGRTGGVLQAPGTGTGGDDAVMAPPAFDDAPPGGATELVMPGSGSSTAAAGPPAAERPELKESESLDLGVSGMETPVAQEECARAVSDGLRASGHAGSFTELVIAATLSDLSAEQAVVRGRERPSWDFDSNVAEATSRLERHRALAAHPFLDGSPGLPLLGKAVARLWAACDGLVGGMDSVWPKSWRYVVTAATKRVLGPLALRCGAAAGPDPLKALSSKAERSRQGVSGRADAEALLRRLRHAGGIEPGSVAADETYGAVLDEATLRREQHRYQSEEKHLLPLNPDKYRFASQEERLAAIETFRAMLDHGGAGGGAPAAAPDEI